MQKTNVRIETIYAYPANILSTPKTKGIKASKKLEDPLMPSPRQEKKRIIDMTIDLKTLKKNSISIFISFLKN